MFITERFPACHGVRDANDAETDLRPGFRQHAQAFRTRTTFILYSVDSPVKRRVETPEFDWKGRNLPRDAEGSGTRTFNRRLMGTEGHQDEGLGRPSKSGSMEGPPKR